jgi:hypothetical protein
VCCGMVFKRSQGYFKMGRMSNSPSPIPVELPTMDNGSTQRMVSYLMEL